MAALVADYGSDSSDSEDDCNVSDSKTTVSNVKDKVSLTPADIILQQVVHDKSSSVFANPFLEAEKSLQSNLEKHVKMTSAKESVKEKANKKICYKFQKGKCTFGDKCKYFHPPLVSSATDHSTAENSTAVVIPLKTNLLDNENEDDNVSKPKKKRYGLKNTLEPPKGYMKMYSKHKNNL